MDASCECVERFGRIPGAGWEDGVESGVVATAVQDAGARTMGAGVAAQVENRRGFSDQIGNSERRFVLWGQQVG